MMVEIGHFGEIVYILLKLVTTSPETRRREKNGSNKPGKRG
jgi:hypothetical protein